ncbi:Ionotropic glutamate kainate receptor 2-like b [Caligus rogercresseyi]|uniref:Ionotropic glutamate kainate receptor 2-like b n=1 Tax=Caligus rogercresseyi TaxID=217165 RepID=A0A7T8GWW6_CALRO|nr:Ionotropic glutamate kainate receptor 2-like b [Caligus rogercresseyi]
MKESWALNLMLDFIFIYFRGLFTLTRSECTSNIRSYLCPGQKKGWEKVSGILDPGHLTETFQILGFSPGSKDLQSTVWMALLWTSKKIHCLLFAKGQKKKK